MTQKQHVEEFARIGALFNRAIATSSQREKDAGLSELKVTSVEQVQALENQIKLNEKKAIELKELQDKFNVLQGEYDKTVLNKRLLEKLLERDLEINQKKTIKEIQQLEEDISHYSHLERPNLMKEAMDRKERNGILLYDVKTQRIEECIYSLRKRILEVDKNQAFSSQIKAEFGSIFGLIDTYDQLTKENKRLKNEEYSVSSDPLSKRRNITKMSNIAARDLLAFLQQQYKTETDSLDTLHMKETTQDAKDFDDICNDQNFLQKPSNSGNEKDLKVLEKEYNDLLAQKQSLPEPVFDPTGQFHGRDGKLLELLTFLVKDLHKRNSEIQENDKQIEKITKDLYEMAKSLRNEKMKYYGIFDPFHSLLDSYVKLTQNQKQNMAVLNTLASISSSFSVSSESMESYIRQKVVVLARLRKQQHELEMQQAHEQSMAPLMGRGKRSRRQSPSRDGSNRLKKMMSMPSSKFPKFVDQKEIDSIVRKSTKVLPKITFDIVQDKDNINFEEMEYHFTNFYSASILCDLMAPIFNHPAKRLSDVWHSIYNGLISIVKDDFKNFAEDMQNQFSVIRQCSHQLLCAEKADAESQTEFAKFMDVEVQNEEKPLHPPKKKPETKKEKRK